MPYHVLSSVGAALNRHKKAVNGARVLVLGVAYKKDIDDLRESPALTIIELLQKDGAEVSYHDPYFPFIGKGRKYDLQMKRTELKGLGQYDCILIVTDHSDYDYKKIVPEAQLVVDTRNARRGSTVQRLCAANQKCRLNAIGRGNAGFRSEYVGTLDRAQPDVIGSNGGRFSPGARFAPHFSGSKSLAWSVNFCSFLPRPHRPQARSM